MGPLVWIVRLGIVGIGALISACSEEEKKPETMDGGSGGVLPPLQDPEQTMPGSTTPAPGPQTDFQEVFDARKSFQLMICGEGIRVGSEAPQSGCAVYTVDRDDVILPGSERDTDGALMGRTVQGQTLPIRFATKWKPAFAPADETMQRLNTPRELGQALSDICLERTGDRMLECWADPEFGLMSYENLAYGRLMVDATVTLKGGDTAFGSMALTIGGSIARLGRPFQFPSQTSVPLHFFTPVGMMSASPDVLYRNELMTVSGTNCRLDATIDGLNKQVPLTRREGVPGGCSGNPSTLSITLIQDNFQNP